MPVYEYKAVLENGQVITDKINTEGSLTDTRDKLAATGLKIITIKKKGFDLDTLLKGNTMRPQNKKGAVGLSDATVRYDATAAHVAELETKVKSRKSFKEILSGDVKLQDINLDFFRAYMKPKETEVISFTEMFLLLKRSNFTNIRAMTTLYQNAQNPAMKSIMGDILNGMETGNYIYTTMEYYPKVFNATYVNLIRVGEKTGSLVNSLAQALTYLQESREIRTKVRKALLGPLLQAVGMLIGAVLCIIFGLPVMEDMYASYGLTDQIPAATMAVAHFIAWCGDHWYIILSIIVGATVAFVLWKKTPGRQVYVG